MKILVADDEMDVRKLIATQLTEEGYDVIEAADGVSAYSLFQQENPDIALLDVMMPKIDGLNLLRKIRESSDMPVILVTARGEEWDKVSGLSQGADDYLVKPFSIAELSARVAVQMKHLKKENRQDEKQNYSLKDLTLDISSGIVKKNGKQIDLNTKEYFILKYLFEHIGKIVTKKQIYQAVWQEEYLYDDNTVMVQLSRLRNKIEDNPKEPQYIITKKGIGYKLNQDI